MRVGIMVDSLKLTAVDGVTFVANGGVGCYVSELLAALLQEDSENEYVLIRSAQSQSVSPAHPRVKEAVFPSPVRGMNKLGLWREWVVAREKIDVVHEPEPHYGAFRLSRYPLVVTVHDLICLMFPHYFTKLHTWNFKLFASHNIARANAIIAVSEHTRADMERLFPAAAGKTKVIYEAGQSLDFTKPADSELLLGFGVTKPYILTVATIEPRKNHLALLDAYVEIRRAGIDLQLVMIGPNGWRNDAVYRHEVLTEYGQDIIYTGLLVPRQLAEFYRQAFVFIYPSFYEGFGMPPLEAMGAGVPVMVGRNSSLVEVLGDAAYYFGPRPTGREIAAAVADLVAHPGFSVRLAGSGQRRAREFDWRRTARETLQIYESVGRGAKA